MLTTDLAMQAIAWERAPRHSGSWINRRVVCADGFTVSIQASSGHYANDTPPEGAKENAPYWRLDGTTYYPFRSVEIGNPSEADMSALDKRESGGVWAFVPVAAAASLLDAHGGAVRWEEPKSSRRSAEPRRLCDPEN